MIALYMFQTIILRRLTDHLIDRTMTLHLPSINRQNAHEKQALLLLVGGTSIPNKSTYPFVVLFDKDCLHLYNNQNTSFTRIMI